MYGISYIIAKKKSENKPYTVCTTDGCFLMPIFMSKNKKANKKAIKNLFEQFGNGKDKTEKPISLKEAKELTGDTVYMIDKMGNMKNLKRTKCHSL